VKKKFFKKLSKPEFQKFNLKQVTAELKEKIISEFDNASSSGMTDISISFMILKPTFKTFILPHFDFCLSLCIYYRIELRKELKKLYYICLRKLLNIYFHHNNANNMIN
jgi:hypothetical protein